MAHKLVEVPNPREPNATTFKCSACSASLSISREAPGVTSFYRLAEDGQPAMFRLFGEPPRELPDSVNRYIGECPEA